MIEKSLPGARLEVLTRCPDFAVRLIHSQDEPSVAVISLSRKEGLVGLLSVRDMITDTPIIAVLPDDSRESIRLAHRLRPQYISYLGRDYSELISVIRRMIDIRKRRGRPL